MGFLSEDLIRDIVVGGGVDLGVFKGYWFILRRLEISVYFL